MEKQNCAERIEQHSYSPSYVGQPLLESASNGEALVPKSPELFLFFW